MSSCAINVKWMSGKSAETDVRTLDSILLSIYIQEPLQNLFPISQTHHREIAKAHRGDVFRHYIVSSGALNSTHSLTFRHSQTGCRVKCTFQVADRYAVSFSMGKGSS